MHVVGRAEVGAHVFAALDAEGAVVVDGSLLRDAPAAYGYVFFCAALEMDLDGYAVIQTEIAEAAPARENASENDALEALSDHCESLEAELAGGGLAPRALDAGRRDRAGIGGGVVAALGGVTARPARLRGRVVGLRVLVVTGQGAYAEEPRDAEEDERSDHVVHGHVVIDPAEAVGPCLGGDTLQGVVLGRDVVAIRPPTSAPRPIPRFITTRCIANAA